MENSTLPQCLCWTDWEMHHTSELQQRSPGEACQRDKRAEQDVMLRGNRCIISCPPCIDKAPLDFLYIAILLQIKNENTPPFPRTHPRLSARRTLLSDVDSALGFGDCGGPTRVSGGAGGGGGGAAWASLCLLLCGWSARLLKLLLPRRVRLKR